MDFYEEYKPFRNYLRGFDRLASLVDVWRYSLHLSERQPLPYNYPVGKSRFVAVKDYLHPWDLGTLSRELVLNADKGSYNLGNWNHLAKAINYIRRLEGEAYTGGQDGVRPDVLLELHRLIHRQFPWQTAIGVNPIVRVFKVFGEAKVDEIVLRELGMTTHQFLKLGLAVTGHFFKKWGMSTNQYYGVLGISREASDAFLNRITCTMEELKTKITAGQSYGCDWIYAWNPLEATPLIRFDPTYPDRVICPIPRYLNHRGADGIFYDLVRSSGFSNPFGDSFQDYIGEVLSRQQ